MVSSSIDASHNALSLIHSMEEILSRQAEVYRALVSLAAATRDCLVNSDLQQLERVVKNQESLVVLMGKLEDQRLQIHATLAALLEYDPQDKTIETLCRAVGRPHSERLEALCEEIKSLLHQLTEANKMNSMLIKDALAFIKQWLDQISEFKGDLATYDKGAEQNKMPRHCGKSNIIDELV